MSLDRAKLRHKMEFGFEIFVDAIRLLPSLKSRRACRPGRRERETGWWQIIGDDDHVHF